MIKSYYCQVKAYVYVVPDSDLTAAENDLLHVQVYAPLVPVLHPLYNDTSDVPGHLRTMITYLRTRQTYNTARTFSNIEPQCSACRGIAKFAIKYARGDFPISPLISSLETICYYFVYRNKHVCSGIINREKDVVLYVLRHSSVTPQQLCSLIMSSNLISAHCGTYRGPRWTVHLPLPAENLLSYEAKNLINGYPDRFDRVAEGRASEVFHDKNGTAIPLSRSDRIYSGDPLSKQRYSITYINTPTIIYRDRLFNDALPYLKVLHLTDIHFDPKYRRGANADCEAPICCREDSGPARNRWQRAGKYGNYGKCDSPRVLIEHMLHHISEHHSDINQFSCYVRFVTQDINQLSCYIHFVTQDINKLSCYIHFATQDINKLSCYIHFVTQDINKLSCYIHFITQDINKLSCYIHFVTQDINQLSCYIHFVTQDIDYVMYTGDSVAHDLWKINKRDNSRVISRVGDMIRYHFPNIPIYGAVGNHEISPRDSFPPPEVRRIKRHFNNQWLYNLLADQWQSWLPHTTISPQARITGSYSVLVRPGFRIISMNTNFCYKLNLWVLFKSVDPGNILSWLVSELLKAEANREYVHIIGHMGPLYGDCYEEWGHQFSRIVTRFASTIRGQFYGHCHRDTVLLHFDVRSPDLPIGVEYLTPSNGPFFKLNPSFTIFYIDGDHKYSTREVLDYETYFMNLTQANAYDEPRWQLLYRAKRDLKMAALGPRNWDNLAHRIARDVNFGSQFYRYHVKASDPLLQEGCDPQCQQEIVCSFVEGDKFLPKKCRPRR
ncbi:Calcineurin-like phosphoesterase domain ApaH type [Trinorchestia longiramus]|nr:Calcineurin-like phosphoesterase domain ApaH type [Trinorchestia longiramus]